MKHLRRWHLNDGPKLQRLSLLAYIIHALLIGTIYVESSQQCSPGLHYPGWTEPKGDIILEVGSTLELYCHLNTEYIHTRGYSSQNIVFYNGSTLVDHTFVTIVNETTAKLRIDEVAVSTSMFYCKLTHDRNNTVLPNIIEKFPASESNDEEKLVCLNEVSVGCKPKEVSHFTCVSYNWEYLNVSWTAPNNGIATNYTVFYQTPKRAGRGTTYSCPNDEDKNYGRCMWSLHTNPIYRNALEYLSFTINGVNRFGNSSQTFKIHHFAHILPAPPQALKAVSKTVSSVYLTWNIGALHLLEKGLIYKITYTWSTEWYSYIFEKSNVYIKNDQVSVNITGLKYPNVAYNFRVYSKSAIALGDEFWSDPAPLVVRTKPCAPYKSPLTDIGSFEIIHETTTHRDVLIYWKALSEFEHNGDNFYYSITVVQNNEEIFQKPTLIDNSYAKFTNLNFDSYTFYIRSVNVEGSAKSASVIRVPKKSDIIPEPIVFTKIDYGDGIYELSWKPSDVEQNKIVNFTTFWCESNKDRPYQCDGLLDWRHLSSNTTKRNFTINSTSNYQFAISANSETSSSGMIWASCTALHNKLTKMKNVWIGKIGSYFIDVRWKLECSERIDSIKGYYVYYCPISDSDKSKCTELEKTLKVFGDVTTMHANISNLKPFTTYRIQVAVFIQSGIIGPRSEELFNKTLDGPPDVKSIKIEPSNITNHSIHLHWEMPQVTNGILQHFKVKYNDETVLVNDTQITLNNLTSYTCYDIRIFACTLFCSEIEPIMVYTKIGTPGMVSKPSADKINSSHVLVKWNAPLLPAGPNPEYDVRVQFDEMDKNSTVYEFETSDTKAMVAIPNCFAEGSRNSYTLHVRAKNADLRDAKVQYFVGEWSPAYSINCMQGGISTLWKIMLCSSLLLIVLSVAVFWGKKFVYKCQQMQDFDVTLPPKFINPPLFNDLKQQDYHINIANWSDDHAECDRLNSKGNDQDQSSVDCIDMEMDTDRDTDRSSSGCYTGIERGDGDGKKQPPLFYNAP